MKRNGLRVPVAAASKLLVVGAILTCIGCGGSEPKEMQTHQGEYPYRVVATVGMVADIARALAGDKANVESLIGEGVDPHQHNLTTQNMRDLIDADVIFYSGLLLEGRMMETFDEMKDSGKPVFAVTDAVDRDKLRAPEELDEHADPHLWMDVQLWRECVEFTAESLSRYDEANEEVYRQNASAYMERLDELDKYVRGIVETVPEEQRVLITAHDAFGYFGQAYGIEVLAPQGISTESEASVEDINQLVRLIVDRKIGAIFVESSVNRKSIEAIIEGAAEQGQALKVGGTLFSDAMGAAGTYEGTYIGMIDHNATVIVRALGGEAPENGWQGKLAMQDP